MFGFAILKAVGKAVMNVVGAGVAGDILAEFVPEVARDAWERWGRGRKPEEQQAELQALAQAPPDEVRQAAEEVVNEVAAGRPEEEKRALAAYLTQVPVCLRQSLRTPIPGKPATFLPELSLQGPDDLVPLLPSRLPRFKPGDRPLAGVDWELVELLGVGGFGEVWKARNPHFDGVPAVALKFCLDPSTKDRLLRHEAAVLNQVIRHGRHPGIVSLRQTYLSAEPPCLEYEYVSGGDLAGLVRELVRRTSGQERVERVSGLVGELFATVGFAHRLRPPVVHRDLKPANILVQATGDGWRLRVIDFGISGIVADRLIALTRGGMSQGSYQVSMLRGAHTPLYASPQQMRGQPPDPRDDVHALGVIWYQLLTGNLGAGRPGGTRWLQKLVDQGMPSAAVDLLASCVEEDPADRPRDAAELAERFQKATGPAVTVVSSIEPPKPRIELLPRIDNSVGLRLALVPAGTFLMGSPPAEENRQPDEGPQHRVTITRSFYLGIYPVTQRQFQAVMNRNPSFFTKANGGGLDHPVEQVTWDEATEFCRKLSALPAEKAAGRTYRLPTEAEWEYACRAGGPTAFCFGDVATSEQANFDGSKPYRSAKRGANRQKTTPVGSIVVPHPFGLMDLHGNVWEWCSDWYDEHYYQSSPAADPSGPRAGDKRVLRGGSWNNSGHLCRAARRNKYPADFRNANVGFRVVVEINHLVRSSEGAA